MITSRIDAITKVSGDYRGTVIPAPPSVKIELTSHCNFSCGFCAHKMKLKGRTEMDWKFYKHIVKEMVEAGVKELGLFYIGESLLCDWLPKAISYAKKAGIEYTFLTTNGSLVTPKAADAIMKAGLDSLKFSYNHADAEQFSKITGVSSKFFEKIKWNIQATHELRKINKYTTKLYASSILYDGEQQDKMKLAVADILPYVDEHYYLPLYSFGSLATNEEKKIGYKPTAGNMGRIGGLVDPLPCWAVFREGHITSDGLLSACCFDAGDKWIMGDLNKVSFMDGWNSDKFQELRKAHLVKDVSETVCKDCVAYV